MRNRLSFVLIILILSGCAANRPAKQITPGGRKPFAIKPVRGVERLGREIEAILQDSLLLTTNVGLKVVRVRDGRVLYERNSRKFFHPASNMKLFVAAAALIYLGPDYRFVTRVATDSGAAVSDTLHGNIYLIGSGNPDFSFGDLAYLVESLYAAGIRYVAGDIICDDSYLDDIRYGNGWMWDEGSSDLYAPIGALTVQDNSVDVYVAPEKEADLPARVWLVPATDYVKLINQTVTIAGAKTNGLAEDSLPSYEPLEVERRWRTGENIIDVTGTVPIGSPIQVTGVNIVDPTRYFGTLFWELCRRMGIEIAGEVKTGAAPEHARLLARHVSPPLSTIITNMNKPSDNLSAELLLKVIGAETMGPPGTADKGIFVIKKMLAGWGADTSHVQFADGSGVSRYNLVTPDLLVRLLVQVYRDFTIRSEFIASLPIGGLDGTLARRMKQTAAMGVVHAKTGSLNGVSTLSGYTLAYDGEVLAFSIMMSHFVEPARRYRQLQDQICDVLTRYAETVAFH